LGFLKLLYNKFVKTTHLCLAAFVCGGLGVSPVMSGRLHGCCCDKVGLLCNATTYTAAVADFEKIYDGKAEVIRVTDVGSLNECSVVFFGIIKFDLASNQTDALYPSYDNFIGLGDSASLMATLSSYVSSGGKVVAIGDSVTRSGNAGVTRGFLIDSEIATMNTTLAACRAGVTAGLSILPDIATANQTTCSQQNLGCTCGGVPIVRYTVKQVNVADASGATFKTSEDQPEVWISAFGVGHSSGGVSLTDTVPATFVVISDSTVTTEVCLSTSATLRPFAYEQVGSGYVMYLGDRNMFAWNRSLTITGICPATAVSCGGSACAFPTTISCFSGALANFTGHNVFEVNKYFLWNLLKKCSAC
jgi:hypothetical protein